jgi:hypothetical protein
MNITYSDCVILKLGFDIKSWTIRVCGIRIIGIVILKFSCVEMKEKTKNIGAISLSAEEPYAHSLPWAVPVLYKLIDSYYIKYNKTVFVRGYSV